MKIKLCTGLLFLIAVGGCATTAPSTDLPPTPSPIRVSVSPHIRIALTLGVSRPEFSGTGGLRIVDSADGDLALVGAGESITADLSNGRVRLGGVNRERLILMAADPSGTVAWNGGEYGGSIELRARSGRLQLVNRITLEEYLVGVVAAEIGNRPAAELAAVEAQAIAARTYALRNLPASSDRGYDLFATDAHQVYRGSASTLSVVAEAVEQTRGVILTYGGEPIDAFYSSTCGGRSEAGVDVFPGADRPYLQSQADVGPDDRAWCSISPRYRWSVRWNAAELVATLSKTLESEGHRRDAARGVSNLSILSETRSGHVNELELSGAGGITTIAGSAIRRVLAPPTGGILPSSNFVVRIDRDGSTLKSVELEGRGFGHGVGMCQWGAIGRARAGQSYRSILMHYFPGTTLERIY